MCANAAAIGSERPAAGKSASAPPPPFDELRTLPFDELRTPASGIGRKRVVAGPSWMFTMVGDVMFASRSDRIDRIYRIIEIIL
jgi:hypothetical protein